MGRRRGSTRRGFVRTLAEEAALRFLKGATKAIGALPARWVLAAADGIGDVVWILDARGRSAGRENLDVIFRDDLDPTEKRRIVRQGIRGSVRAILVTLHAAPLTPERFRAWVDVPPEAESTLREAVRGLEGAVVASAHFGNWEILIGLAGLFPEARPLRFLVEDSFHPVVDRFMAWLRGTGGSESARRRGGALALRTHLKKGGLVGLVVDRNAKREIGGVWAPFCGLEARTTPLPAWLARQHDVPIAPLFCMPQADGRYRVLLEPEPSRDVRTDDFDADVLEITTRLNRLVERRIREHPEAWNWTLKRFKSRPTEAQGRYPAYSFHDP